MIPIEFKVCGQGNNPQSYDDCKKFIEEWSRILRIQDWKIGLSFLSGIETHGAMGSDDYNAFCERTTNNKTAYININAESSQVNNDLEKTLIHELLHVVLDDWQTVVELAVKDEYALKIIKMKMEQTIESLASSFASFVKKGDSNTSEEKAEITD